MNRPSIAPGKESVKALKATNAYNPRNDKTIVYTPTMNTASIETLVDPAMSPMIFLL
jgi:hypothetical protein